LDLSQHCYLRSARGDLFGTAIRDPTWNQKLDLENNASDNTVETENLLTYALTTNDTNDLE
jgi:hypothetical protein